LGSPKKQIERRLQISTGLAFASPVSDADQHVAPDHLDRLKRANFTSGAFAKDEWVAALEEAAESIVWPV
jgi:hypothetical protein